MSPTETNKFTSNNTKNERRDSNAPNSTNASPTL